jgi:hypothetical protein
MTDIECPWCHGTNTQFCNNPDCRPSQPQPAQYTERDGSPCLGMFVALSVDVMAGLLCIATIAIYKLFT